MPVPLNKAELEALHQARLTAIRTLEKQAASGNREAARLLLQPVAVQLCQCDEARSENKH